MGDTSWVYDGMETNYEYEIMNFSPGGYDVMTCMAWRLGGLN